MVKTDKWMIVFNEIHNSHLSMNVGKVDVKTDEEEI
jgi:hypothetical protein